MKETKYSQAFHLGASILLLDLSAGFAGVVGIALAVINGFTLESTTWVACAGVLGLSDILTRARQSRVISEELRGGYSTMLSWIQGTAHRSRKNGEVLAVAENYGDNGRSVSHRFEAVSKSTPLVKFGSFSLDLRKIWLLEPRQRITACVLWLVMVGFLAYASTLVGVGRTGSTFAGSSMFLTAFVLYSALVIFIVVYGWIAIARERQFMTRVAARSRKAVLLSIASWDETRAAFGRAEVSGRVELSRTPRPVALVLVIDGLEVSVYERGEREPLTSFARSTRETFSALNIQAAELSPKTLALEVRAPGEVIRIPFAVLRSHDLGRFRFDRSAYDELVNRINTDSTQL